MDIFELSSMNAAFKISGQEHKLVDPNFLDKVNVLKEFDAISNVEAPDRETKYQLVLRLHENKKKYIKVYLPTLTDEILSTLGEKALDAIYDKLTELAGAKFGAVINKIELEKKP